MKMISFKKKKLEIIVIIQGKKYCKVRDPCHYAKEYRGIVHNICNVKCSAVFLKEL